MSGETPAWKRCAAETVEEIVHSLYKYRETGGNTDDVDGDQLNVVVDPLFVSIAERNVKKYKVIPLFYDANKAAPEVVSNETLFNGLKRAHDYSSGGITSIGEISNMLTRLWNKDKPDRIAAAWLTMFNNLVIDHFSVTLQSNLY